MLFKTIALSLFAAVAAAQNSTLTSLVSQLPECASTCFSSSASTAGCATTDFDCLCGDKKQAFINAIGPCLILDNSCSSDELSGTYLHNSYPFCLNKAEFLTLHVTRCHGSRRRDLHRSCIQSFGRRHGLSIRRGRICDWHRDSVCVSVSDGERQRCEENGR
ncbi:uncharacterized protein BCR38DRAFT_47488 [Pseudomassariella vexata]|uniref:CFEM domain-containing protein n=1 Tax=Pseudomassariella vexata TaxID=1141098 RepID=A0A1Y2DNF1_9PEZI|nr:uncharacterized protein BCR38DRAFT_47488 [Pseudomassariella vexata]ORY60818.1 hypothetical protein BCR38DRAFT_47488 [Pseudomassariella vexata]